MINSAATPSAFADWVFRKTKGNLREVAPARPSETSSLFDQERRERCRRGVADHKEIDRLLGYVRLHTIGCSSDYARRFSDNDKTRDEAFEIPSLRIDGQPLRGRPDLVLQSTSNGHIVIVERKTTHQGRVINQFQEKGNWKNIEAQLWCYSYIKDWDAPHQKITLIGELWCTFGKSRTPVRVGHLVWHKEDQVHEKECRDLFEMYRVWGRAQSL